jgi:hypothetical protein
MPVSLIFANSALVVVHKIEAAHARRLANDCGEPSFPFMINLYLIELIL